MRAPSLIAAFAALAAAPAGAQTWEPVEAPEGVTAVSARWPSGRVVVARCGADGRLDLILTLDTPVAQPTAAVRMILPDGLHDHADTPEEEAPDIWRLSPAGNLLFARQPARLSRFLAGGATARFTLEPVGGAPQDHEITAPADPDALLAVVAACGHPVALPVAADSVVEHPDWVQRPSGYDLAHWYPAAARNALIEGRAIIQCKVTLDERVEDCLVESESPEGMGFGPATVGIASGFRLRPTRVDGVPVDEAIVRIPISWRLG